MKRALVLVIALAAVACKKEEPPPPQNLASVKLSKKTTPALPFQVEADGIIVPIGVAALIHIAPLQGNGQPFTHPWKIAPSGSFHVVQSSIDEAGADVIIYGSEVDLNLLEISASNTGVDTGEVFIPVAVTEQDGFLFDGSAPTDSGPPADTATTDSSPD